MDWVKRNLTFVIGAAVAAGLLGFSGWYLLKNTARNAEAREALEREYTELQRLHRLDPHPGKGNVDNIKLAREQTEELKKFMAQVAAKFASVPAIPPTEKVTSEQLSAALRRTVDQLTRQAANSSVELPPKYNFSFEAQKPLVRFDPNSLNRVATQLGEVKAICDILMAARVNSLENIRRERVSQDDLRGPQTDYLTDASVTNDLAVISTYEVSFKSFSTELADVVSGFANTPYGMVLKAINVEPASASTRTGVDPYGAPYGSAYPSPYGRGAFPGEGEEAVYAPPAVPAYTPTTPAYTPPPPTRYPTPQARYGGEGDFGGAYGGGAGGGIRYPTFNRPTFNTPGGEYGGMTAPGYTQPGNPYGAAYPTTPYGYAAAAPRGAAASSGLVTLIDEEPLSIVMVIKVIKLLPAEPQE